MPDVHLGRFVRALSHALLKFRGRRQSHRFRHGVPRRHQEQVVPLLKKARANLPIDQGQGMERLLVAFPGNPKVAVAVPVFFTSF
jgi:hypothetical protein